MTAYVFALILLVVYPLALSVWAGWRSGWRGLGTPARGPVRERREHEELLAFGRGTPPRDSAPERVER